MNGIKTFPFEPGRKPANHPSVSRCKPSHSQNRKQIQYLQNARPVTEEALETHSGISIMTVEKLYEFLIEQKKYPFFFFFPNNRSMQHQYRLQQDEQQILSKVCDTRICLFILIVRVTLIQEDVCLVLNYCYSLIMHSGTFEYILQSKCKGTKITVRVWKGGVGYPVSEFKPVHFDLHCCATGSCPCLCCLCKARS